MIVYTGRVLHGDFAEGADERRASLHDNYNFRESSLERETMMRMEVST